MCRQRKPIFFQVVLDEDEEIGVVFDQGDFLHSLLSKIAGKRYRTTADSKFLQGRGHVGTIEEFSPAKFGFVCSKAEAEALVKRKWTLEHANNAHTWSLDRESCKPALAFAA